MYGVVTRNEDELTWPEFEIGFFEMKDVTGRATTPVAEGVNMISCFGDNAAVEGDPSIAAQNEEGELATRDRPYFDWDYVCPTADEYRAGIMAMIDDAVDQRADVRLDDVGFPRAEYCHCDRCQDRFGRSEYDEWTTWRNAVITEFVADARARIPGRLYLTLYPDPYPGHLERRSGLDLTALEEHVDEFVIPIYDMAYSTTYWLEALASGFADRLSTPMSIELYAIDIEIDNLIQAAEVASEYGERVLFGYQSGNARAAIRRLRASEREGTEYP